MLNQMYSQLDPIAGFIRVFLSHILMMFQSGYHALNGQLKRFGVALGFFLIRKLIFFTVHEVLS